MHSQVLAPELVLERSTKRLALGWIDGNGVVQQSWSAVAEALESWSRLDVVEVVGSSLPGSKSLFPSISWASGLCARPGVA